LAPWGEWDVRAIRRLRRFIADERVDVLHAHTGHALGLGGWAVRGSTTRFVATRRVDFRPGRWSRWKYLRPDAWGAISGEVRRRLEEVGVLADSISVIPSGIDPAAYPSEASRSALRKARGFTDGERLVVHVGALVPHKDQATLLRAFTQVPDASLLILGEGPLRGELEHLSRALGIEERVRFLGHRSDALDYTALADLFVFSSKEEGLGTALLDALAVGVPTAATAAGGVPDIYGGADAPELSSPGDSSALAANMRRVFDVPGEGPRRVARGRERLRGFTAEAMAARYEELYRRLVP
jgi:glycosyltransferase involved in cell wall biosynthesis